MVFGSRRSKKKGKAYMENLEEVQAIFRKMEITDRISTMLICLHGSSKGDLFGEIFNCYIEDSVPFINTGDMILKIDQICDRIGTPHPSTEPRFLNREMEKNYQKRMEGKSCVQKKGKIQLFESGRMVMRAVKARETLLVKVEYRQHSCLQGRIQGNLTNGKQVGFRSSLELMRMIREIAIMEDKR